MLIFLALHKVMCIPIIEKMLQVNTFFNIFISYEFV